MPRESEPIRIFDTTLRDGEQTPGVSLTPRHKLEIAQQLDRLGVDVIEAGFPITSRGEREAFRLIAQAGLRAEVCGLARTERSDIDAVLDCDAPFIHVFIATSEIHLKHKLKLSPDQALERAVEGVEYARRHGLRVEFSAEDSTRSDTEFVLRVLKAVAGAGAERVDLPDTVGIMTPERMANFVSQVYSAVPVPISVHCHDDFGLAVANTLAGLKAGATEAHVTINGIGERAGNASLEEVVMALHSLRGVKTRINTKLLAETSLLVSKLCGIAVQPNKAVVGENAFGHKSGIHVHGVLQYPGTYEPLEPEIVGRRRWIQAGKHSGRHGVKAQLQELGISPSDEQLTAIVERVKDLGDRGRVCTDHDLVTFAREVMKQQIVGAEAVALSDLAVVTGLSVVPTASVRFVVNGESHIAAETGVGPVDAAIRAIQKVSDRFASIRLKEYRLNAISGGSDSLAEAWVKVETKDGMTATARAVGSDVVVSSVNAMMGGINMILMKNRPVRYANSSPQKALQPPEP
jgi:2-isopropylmalate synthase